MRIQATNKASGEVVDMPANTPEEIVNAWHTAQEYEKVAKALKDQLKLVVPAILQENNQSAPIGNFMFRRVQTQRTNYDKSALRTWFDEDTYDLFVEVKKKAVQEYIKENQDNIEPQALADIKASLQPTGNVVEMIRLERLGNER